jgi:hypothetical protein
MGLFSILMMDSAVRQPQTHLATILTQPKLQPSTSFKLRLDIGSGATASGDPGAAVDDASRNQIQAALMWEPFGEDLIGGDRLAVTSASPQYNEVWELAGPAVPHRILGGPLVWTAQAYRLRELYPATATIRKLGGEVVATGVPIGIWQTSPGRAGEAAAIYDYDAELPIEWIDELAPPNRELVVDGSSYKIIDATAHEIAPRVTLRLRRIRPGG